MPHCREAGLLYEAIQGTQLCSDLFHQVGDVEPQTASDIIGRVRQPLVDYVKWPICLLPAYTPHTAAILKRLA